MTHEIFIQKTFELAKQGLGQTWPNPLVGCVIVKNGEIIAEGFHERYGGPHAEIMAINKARESVEGATLYVNLEPCCHTDKQTPPCAQRLVQEKIKKVIISNLDPNPKVNGQGVALLRAHGIEVEFGVLAPEGEKLNEVFFHHQKNKTPFIHLKLASTLDGKIAMSSGESQWITGDCARAHVHELRSYHQGVIVGAKTIRQDNPQLNVRLENFKGHQPYRIVFTHSGEIPYNSKVLTDELAAKTLVFTSKKTTLPLPSENIFSIKDLTEALDILREKKLIHLLLEGGPQLASSFMRERKIQKVSYFINPSFIGDGKNALLDLGIEELQSRPRLSQLESKWLGEDLLITGRLF